MAAAGVIECDGRYEIGSKPFGYRLGTRYRHADFREVTIAGKAAYHLSKKLGRISERRERALDDVGRHLLGWLREVRVSRYAGHACPVGPYRPSELRVPAP